MAVVARVGRRLVGRCTGFQPAFARRTRTTASAGPHKIQHDRKPIGLDLAEDFAWVPDQGPAFNSLLGNGYEVL
jgi:hypothetical protein